MNTAFEEHQTQILCGPPRSQRLCVGKDTNAESRRTLKCAEEGIIQGPGSVYLNWKTPFVGGKGGPVHAYVICRREQPQGGVFGSWEQAGMALERHALLGFFTNTAADAFSDVSVKGLYGVTASPVTPYPGNPVNLTNYSPAVIKDDKFRMGDSLLGQYNESLSGKDEVVSKRMARSSSPFGGM